LVVVVLAWAWACACANGNARLTPVRSADSRRDSTAPAATSVRKSEKYSPTSLAARGASFPVRISWFRKMRA
jgi:hypothetical protein